MYRYVLGQTLQLLTDQVGIDNLGAVNIAGVLHSEAGEHRQGMPTKRSYRLNIGLDTGSAGGVKT
ncbi:hypothetical protein GCM10011362_18890 [Marinobacter halophilus]|nr:hypothetical protein GCM10011362_18890 [Marinobacter halophilus]